MLTQWTRAKLGVGGQKLSLDLTLSKDRQEMIIRDADAPSLARYFAVLSALGLEELDSFEPETIRADLNAVFPGVSEDVMTDVLAVRTLRTTPDFYEDAQVFEKIVQALNSGPVDFALWQEPMPGEMAWAIEAARQVTHGLDPDDDDTEEQAAYFTRFDREVISYVAVVCQRAGMVFLPEDLSFARDELARITPEHDALRADVARRWGELNKNSLREYPFTESAVDVQLALAAAVVEYRSEMEHRSMELLGVTFKPSKNTVLREPASKEKTAALGSRLRK